MYCIFRLVPARTASPTINKPLTTPKKKSRPTISTPPFSSSVRAGLRLLFNESKKKSLIFEKNQSPVPIFIDRLVLFRIGTTLSFLAMVAKKKRFANVHFLRLLRAFFSFWEMTNLSFGRCRKKSRCATICSCLSQLPHSSKRASREMVSVYF